MIKIRNARISELGKVYSVLQEFRRDAYTKELAESLIEEKNSVCIVAIAESRIIATLGARKEGKNAMWIYFLAVRKKYQGKGIATRLNQEFLEKAKRLGIRKIATDTPEPNLFMKFGFKEAGMLPKWYESKDQYIMFRRL